MLHMLVLESIHKHQQQTSVIYDPGDGDTNTLCKISYSLLGQQIAELASVFSSFCTERSIVGVLLTDCAEIPSIYLGLLTAKCAFYPLNSDGMNYSINALSRMAASYIVVHAQFSKKVQHIIKQLDGSEIKSELLLKYGLHLYQLCLPSLTMVPVSDHQNLAYCITTSGTTNKPKIVKVPHCCIVPNILHLRNIFQLSPGDKMLMTAPLTFDPSIIDIFCTLSSGACLVIVPTVVKSKPDKLLTILHDRQSVSVLQATPSLMRSFSPTRLCHTILGPQSALRVLALGGEKFPSRDVRSWFHKDNTKTQFYNLYGITEVSCWATCHPVDIGSLDKSDPGETVPIGFALDKTEVKLVPVLSEEGDSDEGCIWIGSRERVCIIDDEPFIETVQSQDLQAGNLDKIIWRNSGDLGKLLPDGNIICLGRMDDQVKRHGKRLNLGAVEMACTEFPEVSDCCVLLEGNMLLAFVTLDSASLSRTQLAETKTGGNLRKTVSYSGHDLPASQYHGDLENCQINSWKKKLQVKLKNHVQESLPRHYVPDAVVIIDGTFPLTPHGKLDKKHLLKIGMETVGKISLIDAVDPVTFAQKLWQNHVPERAIIIKTSDNFLSLGGDSFAAVQLLNELEGSLKDNLPFLFDILINKDFSAFTAELQKCMYAQNQAEIQPASRAPVQEISSLNVEFEDSKEELISYSERNKTGEVLLETADHATSCDSSVVRALPSNIVKHKISEERHADVGMKIRKTDFDFDSLHTATQLARDLPLSAHPHYYQSMPETDTLDRSLSVFKCSEPRRVISRGKLWSKDRAEVRNTNYCYNDDKHHVPLDCDLRTAFVSKTDSSIAVDDHDCSEKLSLKLKWKFDTKKCVDASPLVIEYETRTFVFIGSHSGQLSAIDVQDGTSLWSITLPDRIESSACSTLCGKYIVVGCYDGCVYFLDSMTGSVIWDFATQDVVKCSPVIDESSGNIIVGSHDGSLYCLDVKTRKCVWHSFLGGGSVFSSPVVDVSKQTVYAATLAGRVTALSLSLGREMWALELGKPVFSSLCLFDDVVLIGCVDGNLYCLTSHGDIRWTFRTQAPIFSSPTVSEDTVVMGSHDQHIYCISETGKLIWRFQATSRIYSSVYVGQMSNFWQHYTDTTSHFTPSVPSHVFDSKPSHGTSSNIFRTQSNFTARISSNVIDSQSLEDISIQTQMGSSLPPERTMSSEYSKQGLKIVVSASTDGNLYLLDHGCGRPLAQFQLPGEVFSSPVLMDKSVLVGCRNNFVYGFEIT